MAVGSGRLARHLIPAGRRHRCGPRPPALANQLPLRMKSVGPTIPLPDLSNISNILCW